MQPTNPYMSNYFVSTQDNSKENGNFNGKKENGDEYEKERPTGRRGLTGETAFRNRLRSVS